MCACREPIDTANNTLVDFGAAFQVGISRISIRDGIDGNAGSVWGHVWHRVEAVNTKLMGREFCKRRLTKMYGHMSVGVLIPSESGSKEEINVTHEVDAE